MINDSKLVNQTILNRNQKHFEQIYSTLFTVLFLSDHTDFTDTKNYNSDILQNDYSNSNLNNITLKLLNNLHLSPSTPRTKKSITKKEFVHKLLIWKKSITISLSGYYLDHYMALVKNHGINPESQPEECQKFDFIRENLIIIYYTLLNYTLNHDYFFQR